MAARRGIGLGLALLARRRVAQLAQPPIRHLSTQASRPPSRFAAHLPRLSALATRTGVPLPSLVVSFALLHELTALIPLGTLFWAFGAAGVGGGVVEWAAGRAERGTNEDDLGTAAQEGQIADDEATGLSGWTRALVRRWLAEGEQRVDRVAARYGIFGRKKGEHSEVLEHAGEEGEQGDAVEVAHGVAADAAAEAAAGEEPGQAASTSKAAAGIANALAAYIVVKVGPLQIVPVLHL